MVPTVDIRAAGLSHIGRVRQRNEDAYHVGDHLVAVADGLGGHVAGDIASTVVIDAIRGFDRQVPPEQLVDAAADAVDASNRALRTQIDADPSLAGMGTTLVAMLWSGTTVAAVNVGDSRIYRHRKGRTEPITDDHVFGRLVFGADRVPGLAERLTRFLNGRPEGVSADITRHELRCGDRYLLCSDGLSSYVPAADIETALGLVDDPAKVADQLVRLALDQGGPDNVTVLVVDVR